MGTEAKRGKVIWRYSKETMRTQALKNPDLPKKNECYVIKKFPFATASKSLVLAS
jgi:hypothetical protein